MFYIKTHKNRPLAVGIRTFPDIQYKLDIFHCFCFLMNALFQSYRMCFIIYSE